jgi:hypothetical protein
MVVVVKGIHKNEEIYVQCTYLRIMNSLHYVGFLEVPKNFWVFRILATAIQLL